MKNIPDKCLKCGAPIKWDKTSNHIDCEYCGYTNLINNLGKFTISEGKKYSFFSSIKKNSQKYLLAIKEKFKKDLKNKNIIFEDLIYKYTRSRKKIAKRNELKILLTALPIGLFVLILNSYINSPLRVQNKKIKDACNQGRIESIKYGATKFKSESKYKECIDFMRETVLSINKVADKSKDLVIYKNLISELEEKLYNETLPIIDKQKKGIVTNDANEVEIIFDNFYENGNKWVMSDMFYSPNKVINLQNNLKNKVIKKCKEYLEVYKTFNSGRMKKMEKIKTKITYLHNQGSYGDYVSQYNSHIFPKSQFAFMRDRFTNHSVTKEWCNLMLKKK